jgi:acetyl-CoA acetyltransferase
MGPPTLFTIPVLRYMKTYGLTHERLAMVSVVQREWAGEEPARHVRAPITVQDVLNSRMMAAASYTPPEPARDREFFQSSRRPRPRCLSVSRRRQ